MENAGLKFFCALILMVILGLAIIVPIGVIMHNLGPPYMSTRSVILNDGSKIWILDLLRRNETVILNGDNETAVIDFDYDIDNNVLVYMDYCFIFKKSLDASEEQNIIESDPSCQFKDLTMDWVTGNLYFIKEKFGNKTQRSIMVRKTEGKSKMIYNNFKPNEHPKSLIVHPHRGYIFFTAIQPTNTTTIYRINADGNELVDISQSYPVGEGPIAIDYEDDRIYWLNDVETLVYSSFLNGTDVQSYEIPIGQIKSMFVQRDRLYVSNLNSIWHVDKETGELPVNIFSSKKNGTTTRILVNAKGYSSKSQTKRDGNPCNGEEDDGCRDFCFAVPGTSNEDAPSGKLEKICA